MAVSVILLCVGVAFSIYFSEVCELDAVLGAFQYEIVQIEFEEGAPCYLILCTCTVFASKII